MDKEQTKNDITIVSVGSIISFRYKGGRFVKGLITLKGNSGIALILHTDYIGKNVEWFSGEKKQFNISEMKNIVKLESKKCNFKGRCDIKKFIETNPINCIGCKFCN